LKEIHISEILSYEPAPEMSYEERKTNWLTAFGLQKVDGLSPSEYVGELAFQNIEGKMSFDEVESAIHAYYQDKNHSRATSERENEADLVSSRIAKLLGAKSFVLSNNSLKTIHKSLFAGIKEYTPGEYRTYDIIKSEWVLDRDTVQYGDATLLEEEMALQLNQEKSFKYSGLTDIEKVTHIEHFISDLWHQHAFLEGNTRTIAVFVIKYLRSNGFSVDNIPFEQNSLYFRNALVRANYRNGATNVEPTFEYLDKFFGNVLLGKHNELHARSEHIYWGINKDLD
jgi:fido (protein-threonine AMPylation protein)